MPTSTTVKGLNINELTEAQYDAAVQGGVIGPNELSVLTDVSYVEPSDLATVATTGDYDDLINKPTIPVAIQVSSMPIAGVDELDKIYQFIGATDASYTNGYFYKCVSDGQTPATYSWEQTDVQPAGSSLPDQTGNTGKFLTTDGTDASWGIAYSFNSYSATWGTATGSYAIGLGDDSQATGTKAVAIGQDARGNGSMALALGYGARVTANNAIQLNTSGIRTNSDANTFKVGNVYGNFEMMSADGTIPEARLADTTNAQQGDVLTLDSNGDAVWQAGGGGGLQNTATGTDGLTILGTASTVNYSINIGVNSKVSQISGVAIGRGSEARAYQSSKLGTAIGTNAFVEGEAGVAIGANSCSYANASGYAVAIGGFANAYDYGIAIGTRTHVFNTAPGAIQLGNCWTNNTSPTQNMDAHTFKVGLRTGTNYELLSSDGTIPTARLTKVNSTITLAAADWSGGSQTVTVTGMTATGVVLVSPDPTDQAAYTSAGILCTAQAADSLTFTATTTPTGDIDVVVVML